MGSPNRQAASQPLEDVRQCGADMRACVLRKRKVDAAVVEGVWSELLLAQVPGSLCWLTLLMTRFYGTVPVSVLGRWCGVHKTTI